MGALDWASVLLVGMGAIFFAGTVGLLRLPDVYSRLHALSKVDNLGLGFVVAGLMPQSGTAGGVNRRRPEHKRVTRQDGARRSYLNHQVTPAVNCIDFACRPCLRSKYSQGYADHAYI